MKVSEIRDVKDCFDGSFMKEIYFDQPISREFILYLGRMGELEYHQHFVRPYFRVDVESMFILKGVEGTHSFRILLDRQNTQLAVEHLTNFMSSYTP